MIVEKYPNELPGVTYNLVVIKPSTFDSKKRYPLVIVLVGIAAKGDNIQALENDIPENVKLAADSDNMIIVAVQTPDTFNDEIVFALDWAFKNLPVGTDSGVYGYGLSYGAGGLWNFIAASAAQAKVFDAVAPIATTWTTIPPDGWKYIADANLRIWAFHNSNDPNGGTPLDATNAFVDAVNALRPGAAAKTIFKANVHGGWGEAATTEAPPYAPGGSGLISPSVTLWKWFKMNNKTTRVSPPSNSIPPSGLLAKATYTIKDGQINLDGSASVGYDSISWTDRSLVKGSWVGGTGWKTAVYKPSKSGEYRFELRVSKGASLSMDVVTVDIDLGGVVIPPNKIPASFDYVSNRLTFIDGTTEVIISAAIDFKTNQTIFKTLTNTYTV